MEDLDIYFRFGADDFYIDGTKIGRCIFEEADSTQIDNKILTGKITITTKAEYESNLRNATTITINNRNFKYLQFRKLDDGMIARTTLQEIKE